MYRIIIFLFIMGLLTSCGQQTNKSEPTSDREIMTITVSDFLGDASPYVEQSVEIQGRVVHVCRHGGQRLFVVGDDGEKRIRITCGEDIAEFDIALEGEMLQVSGIVKELIIDETYLAQWEAEIMEGSELSRGEGHEGGVGHGEDHGDSPAESQETEDSDELLKEQLVKIQNIRDEIAASDKNHLSDYWIETIEYKIINE